MKIIVRLFFLFAFVNPVFAEAADEKYLQSAREYLKKGEPKAAVIQLKNHLRASPFDGEGRMLLGTVYLILRDGEAAVKELEKAQELGIDYDRLMIPLNRAYLMAAKPKMVLERIEDDPQASAESRAIIFALQGMAQLMTNNIDAAKSDFDKALQLDNDSQDALRGMARVELAQQNLNEAVNWSTQAISHDQTDLEALLILGETQRIAGNNPASINAFDQVLALEPANIPARLNRAAVYIADGQLDRADLDIKVVMDSAGAIPLAAYLSGVVAFERKQMEKAKDALLQVLKVIPNHQPSQLMLGTIAYYEGAYKVAQSYLYPYVKNQPTHLPAVKLLAATYMKLQRPAEAAAVLERAADQAQNDAQFLALLGSAYMQDQKFDKGTELLEKASKIAPDVAAIRAQLAIGHFAAGQVEQAVGELENAVDLGQGLVQADVMLVLTLIQQKAYDQAADKARRLAKKMPDNPMPDNLLGAVYLAKGELETARRHWLSALKIQPDYTTAMANIAKLDAKKGRYKEAEEWYQKILSSDDSNLEARLGLAQIAQMQNELDQAFVWLNTAQEKNPDAIEPSLKRAEYELLKGNTKSAYDIVRRLKFKHPDNRSVLRSLGVIQIKADDVSGAIATFRELVSKDENQPEPHHLLAQALSKAGDTSAAKSEWETALQLSPDYLDAAAAQAYLAFQEGRYQESLELARNIQGMHSQSSIGFQLEGDAYSGLKDASKANLAYQSAYQKEPNSYLARRIYQTYRQVGNVRKAESKLQSWLKQNPDDADAWTLQGMGYQEDGEIVKAISAFETAYKINKSNAIAVNNLAWLYQEMGDSRAVATAEELLTLAGENPEMTDTAGWVFLQNGREDRAVVLFQQAILKSPDNSAIRVHLAEALIGTNRENEAKKQLNILLQSPNDFAERLEAEALLKRIEGQ